LPAAARSNSRCCERIPEGGDDGIVVHTYQYAYICIDIQYTWSTTIRWKPGLPAAARSNSRCCEKIPEGGEDAILVHTYQYAYICIDIQYTWSTIIR